MPPTDDPILAALRRSPAGVTRSPLSREVRKRFMALSDLFGDGPVGWAHVARVFGEHGIRDQDGKAPTGEAVRKAFARERKAREHRAERTNARPAAPEMQPDVVRSGVHRIPDPAPWPAGITAAEATEPGEAPQPRFRLATLRGHVPTAKPAATALAATPPPVPAPKRDAERIIAEFLGRAPGERAKQPDPGDE